ncbi:MAG: hypothetical protein AAF961_15300, partial [Planctomycetota bacterium]
HTELYCKGHIEVPSCGPCAPGCVGDCGVGACPVAPGQPCAGQPYYQPAPAMATDHYAPGAVQFENLQPTPSDASPNGQAPNGPNSGYDAELPDPSANVGRTPAYAAQRSDVGPKVNPAYRHILNSEPSQSSKPTHTPGLIGPIGYDVQQ